jgi:hypothetical protein
MLRLDLQDIERHPEMLPCLRRAIIEANRLPET